jgi:hypothetical protein
MRPAKRKPDVATIGQLAVAGIAADLHDTLEAFKMAMDRSDLRSGA